MLSKSMYTATRVPPGSFIVALHLGNIAADERASPSHVTVLMAPGGRRLGEAAVMTEFASFPGARLPGDHDRHRPLHPARSPRAGERHDRAISGDHRPASTPVTGDRALATSGSRSPIAFAASVRAQRIRMTAASG